MFRDPISEPSDSQFAAYMCTDSGADIAREVAHRGGWGPSRIFGGGLSAAARLAPTPAETRFLLVELGNMPLEMACESVAEVVRPGSSLVVLGQANDVPTYRAIVTAGAHEYFPVPVDAQEVVAALRAQAANTPAPTQSTALRIGVVGCSGGVGASILSENLAVALLGGRARPRVALVDLDLSFGSMFHDMNREPTSGMLEALAAPDRIDQTFLDASMDRLSEGLYLYSHQVRSGGDALDLEQAIPRFLDSMSRHFDTIVVDLPRGLLMRQPQLASRLDCLVPVLAPGYAGLNAFVRLHHQVTAEHADLAVIPTVSELRRDAALNRPEMARALKCELRHVLPRCDTAVHRSHRKGLPLVSLERRSGYALAVRRLARAVDAQRAPEPAQPPAARQRWFGR